MSDASLPEKSPLAAAFGNAFQAGWRGVVAADRHDASLDRLAACAEGRLSPAEEAAVAQEIADSPAALEILASLLADQDWPRRLPSVDSTADAMHVAATSSASVTRPPGAVPRERRRTQLAAWAMAASLLGAAWGVIRARNLQNQVASLNSRAHEATTALIVSEKERLAASTPTSSPYLLGATSPELTDLAIADFAEALRGAGTRGRPRLTPEQAAAIAAAQQRLADAAARLDVESSLEDQLEYAAALIDAGKLQDAGELLDRIEQLALKSTSTRAFWENLRAGLYARQAAATPAGQSAPLWTQAETLFRSAAEHELRDAWLNLAQLYVTRGNPTAALEAARQYLAGESNPERREALGQLFEN